MFLNEAFENSVGTQRADMGLYRKFALNLTTVAIPNLIAFDLVMVSPMSSASGYVTYIQYVAGSNKGAAKKGETLFNSPFSLGDVRETVDYTSSKVVEAVTAGDDFAPAWTPVAGSVRFFVNGAWGEATEAPAKVPTGATKVAYEYDNVVIPQNDLPIVNAKMAHIALEAKARRIAIYYSQMAA